MYPEVIILSTWYIKTFQSPNFLCKLFTSTTQVDTVEFGLQKLTQLVKVTENSYLDH